MALALAVINKDNSPLYLRTWRDNLRSPPEVAEKLLYMLHTSLDVIEEKISASAPSKGDGRDLCLGVLYSMDELKLYGYVTNTKIKFIIIVEMSASNQFRDNDIRNWFGRLHTAYTETVCSPFYSPGQQISSKKFDAAVNEVIRKPTF